MRSGKKWKLMKRTGEAGLKIRRSRWRTRGMKTVSLLVAFCFGFQTLLWPYPSLSLGVPSMAQEKKAEEKKEEKAKAEKAKGDVGLLDTEKNYMILVTKEGKLLTFDFDQKTKATMLEEKPVKMDEVGLGSSADVEYVTKGEQKVVTKMEFRPARGE